MAYVQRQRIIEALIAAHVEFDEEATVAELRPLYDQLRRNNGQPADDAQVQEANNEDNDNRRPEDADNRRPEDADNRRPEDVVPDVDAQIAQLEKEMSLLRKRKELQLMMEELDIAESKKYDFAAFEAMVNPFSGDDTYDVRKWFDDVEDAFEVFGCSERDKFISVRRILKGTAKMFLRTTVAHTYASLKQALIEEFGRVYTMNEVFQQLKSRILKPTESVKRYIIEMQEIASHANIPEADVIECIIEGLNDRSNNVVILLGATTIRQLKSLVDRYEKRRARGVQLKVIPSIIPMTKPRNNAAAAATTAARGPDVAAEQIRCFNCSQFGHYQSQCQKPKRPPNSCFTCHEVGHYHQECPRRKRLTAVVCPDEDAADVNEPEAYGYTEGEARKLGAFQTSM